MNLLKHNRRWISAFMALICCVALLPSVKGTACAAHPQVECIEPIWEERGNPGLDATVMPVQDDEPDYEDTMEKVALKLRKQLKDRKSYAVVYLKTMSYDMKTMGTIFDLAVAHTGEPTEGDYILHQYKGHRALLSGYATGPVYYLTLEYFVDYYTTKDQEEELDYAVKDILKQLDLKNATDYQKVKGVYDWLCQNVTYDYDNLEDDSYLRKHTAYAAIIDRTAVCQGYATAMYRLLLELDVDVRYVGGIGNGGPHGWNIVKLGEKYYNLDATWDASRAQLNAPYAYFLKNDTEFTDHQRDNERYDFVNTKDYPIAQDSYVPAPVVGEGDFDHDSAVTNNDVVYLLWHVLFDEFYPVSQNADFTGDGCVNGEDVAYMLWHTLFPNKYPLQ